MGTRIALLALGLVVALLGAEVAVRLLRPPQAAIVRYPCIYEPDPDTGFRYAPGSEGRVSAHFEIDNAARINSLGFYDAEPLPDAEAGLRVLAVGDSFTAAMNVPRDAVWTAVLERELRARGFERADVVNVGLDGTGTDVHVALLERYLPRFAPDVVVLAFFGNDLRDVLDGRFERECYRGRVLSYQTPDQRAALRARVDAMHEERLLGWLVAHSWLARLALVASRGPHDPHRLEFLQPPRQELALGGSGDRARRRALAHSFLALDRLARDCGCRFLVAPVPPRSDAEGSLRLLRRQARDPDFEIVDLLPAMRRAWERDGRRQRDLYFVHDAHFNVYGNELYGSALADVIAAGARP